MNKEELKYFLLCLLAGMVVGGLVGYDLAVRRTATTATERDTVTYTDTITYCQPVPRDSAVVRYVTRVLPAKVGVGITTSEADTFSAGNYAQKDVENIPLPSDAAIDSAAVVIPITQKRYESDAYRAYVSGYAASLDSIFVFPKTTVIHERSYKPPDKWHIGITGGYGWGMKSNHAEPYIGIGITYSIISF